MNKHQLLCRISSEQESMEDNQEEFEINQEQSNLFSDELNPSSFEEEESLSDYSFNPELLKYNLKNYGTMRGLHSVVDISQLPRLNQLTYVQYDDKQTYQSVDVLNRIFKGVPKNEPNNEFEDQNLTKTEFHNPLFGLEDKRYQIDLEILQLKFLLKKIYKIKFNQFEAYQQLKIDQQINLQESIKKEINNLELQKKMLNSDKEYEKQLFYLSIDQKFYNTLDTQIQQYQSHSIKKFYFQRQQSIIKDVSIAFHIDQLITQPIWLLQFEEQYNQLYRDYTLLLPPIHIINFQNKQCLYFTLSLINTFFSKIQQSSKNIQAKKLYLDFVNSFFSIQKSELETTKEISIDSIDIPYNIILELLNNIQQVQCNITVLQQPNLLNCELLLPQPTQENNLLFFPNFLNNEILYSKQIGQELFYLLNEIYYRIYQLISNETILKFDNHQIPLTSLIINLLFKNAKGTLKDAQIYWIFKILFKEQDAIYFSQLIPIVRIWKEAFLSFDEHSKELLMIFIQKQLGVKSEIKLQDAMVNLFITPENILRKMSYEMNQTKLCRIQNNDNVIFIHSFVLQDMTPQM